MTRMLTPLRAARSLSDQVGSWQTFFALASGVGMTLWSALEGLPLPLSLLAGLGASVILFIGLHRYALWAAQAASSPIMVAPQAFVESSKIEDENGLALEGFDAIRFCLVIYNASRAGETIRGIQAHFRLIENVKLPIREGNAGVIDLRQNELAHIEVGTMYRPHGEPYVMSNLDPYIVPEGHRDAIEHNARHGHLGLKVRDVSGKERGIGILRDNPVFQNIPIVIAAEDIASKTVWLTFRPHSEKWQDWLSIYLKPQPDN